MKRSALALAILAAFSTAAWAQEIEVISRTGPNGTHFNLELPISSYTFEADIYTVYSFHHDFKVYHNSVLKVSQSYDVMNPSSPTYFSSNVSFSGWNIAVGDTIRFYNFVKIISGPYSGQRDTDNQYGDVVDLVGCLTPPANRVLRSPAAIHDRRRFEDLLS